MVGLAILALLGQPFYPSSTKRRCYTFQTGRAPWDIHAVELLSKPDWYKQVTAG